MSTEGTEEAWVTFGMGKLKKEGEVAHRAFLLWCMQNPAKRNQRATGRAVNRSPSVIRDYSVRWQWKERAAEITSDQKAQALYRELYFEKYGSKEIAMVESNILSPISVTGTVPSNIAAGVAQIMQETNQPKEETVFDKEVKRRHLDLVDYAIRYVKEQLNAGEIRANLKDIPTLLNLRRELTGEVDPERTGTLVIESVRVAQAKKDGTDLVDAMLADAQELTAILESLSYRGKAPRQTEEVVQ